MEYIYIGKIVNTHGIKGELRLISNFERKDLVFKNNFKIYIGKEKSKYTINTYRKHKNFDMITIVGFNDINDVLQFKNSNVYIDRSSIDSNVCLKTDLINYQVICNNKDIGKVKEFFSNNAYDIMVVKSENGENLIPYLDTFIENIDSQNKKIYIINMEGLINEN